MKSATGKTSVRKVMRVATVFTGAATTAAVFAPAAMAGTGHAAPAHGKTVTRHPVDRTGGIRPMDQTGRVSGSISLASNCAATPHWVHIYGSMLGWRGHDTWCFGFKGIYDVSGGFLADPLPIQKECGGNNSGFLNPKYNSIQSYGPGTGYRNENNYQLNSIQITGWSKNDTCAASPY